MIELMDPHSSYAVLIGVAAYRRLQPLPAVVNNLQDLAAALTDPQVWGLPPDRCLVIADPESPTMVLDQIHDAARSATAALLVYYSGHGILDTASELHLPLADGDQERLHYAIRFADIRREVIATGARCRAKIVMLDCCYSGRAMTGFMSSDTDLVNQAAVEGAYLMTATAETRLALAPVGARHTAFSGVLLDTLDRGIVNGPGLLDMDTIFDHVSLGLRARNFPLPKRRSRDDGHRVAIARNRAATPNSPTLAPSRVSQSAMARPEATVSSPTAHPQLDQPQSHVLPVRAPTVAPSRRLDDTPTDLAARLAVIPVETAATQLAGLPLDVAIQVLARMDEPDAATRLAALPPRLAGDILAGMDEHRAARRLASMTPQAAAAVLGAGLTGAIITRFAMLDVIIAAHVLDATDEATSRELLGGLPVTHAQQLLQAMPDSRRLSIILALHPSLAAQFEELIPARTFLADPHRRLGPQLRYLRTERAVALLLELPASTAADLVRTFAPDQSHTIRSALEALPPQRTVSVWEDDPAFLDQLRRILSECPPAKVVDTADQELRHRPHAPHRVEVQPDWVATVRYYLALPPSTDIRTTQLFQQSQPNPPVADPHRGQLLFEGILGQMAVQNGFINIVKFGYTPGKIISHQRVSLDAVATVILKPATRLVHGYIQIQLHAVAPMPEARISLNTGRPPQRDPYSVSIRRAHNQAARAFKDELDQHIHNQRTLPPRPHRTHQDREFQP